MEVGSRPAFMGLAVDQARLCADPQATLFIFFPANETEMMSTNTARQNSSETVTSFDAFLLTVS